MGDEKINTSFYVEPTYFPVGGWYAMQHGIAMRDTKEHPHGVMPPRFSTSEKAEAFARKMIVRQIRAARKG